MDNENSFSSKEVAEILKKDGYEKISDRTINYYAFEKSMFQVEKSGKKVFTQKEIDKIKGIRILREFGYALNDIKEIINTKSLSEIESLCYSKLTSKLSASTTYNNEPNFLEAADNSFLNDNLIDANNRSCAFLDNRVYINESAIKSNSEKRTIKINNDITLIISANFDDDKLQKIIEIINK